MLLFKNSPYATWVLSLSFDSIKIMQIKEGWFFILLLARDWEATKEVPLYHLQEWIHQAGTCVWQWTKCGGNNTCPTWRSLGLGTAGASGEWMQLPQPSQRSPGGTKLPLTTPLCTHPTTGASLCFQLGTVGWQLPKGMFWVQAPGAEKRKAALSCNIIKTKQNK